MSYRSARDNMYCGAEQLQSCKCHDDIVIPLVVYNVHYESNQSINLATLEAERKTVASSRSLCMEHLMTSHEMIRSGCNAWST
eukprot:6201738-Amphidinium_carterae.1